MNKTIVAIRAPRHALGGQPVSLPNLVQAMGVRVVMVDDGQAVSELIQTTDGLVLKLHHQAVDPDMILAHSLAFAVGYRDPSGWSDTACPELNINVET